MDAGRRLLLLFTWVVLSALALDGRVLSALALDGRVPNALALESISKRIPHNSYKFLSEIRLRNSMEIIGTVM